MRNDNEQAILRLLFAKIANELNIKYKIPKNILPHHFNVFFKNLRFDHFSIESDVSNNHWIYISAVVDFKKTIRELIADYSLESSISPLSYEQRLIHIEEDETYVKMHVRNEGITLGIYDENINLLEILKRNVMGTYDGAYGIDGLFIQGNSLFVHKSLIDKINVFCCRDSAMSYSISNLLSGETFKNLTKNGH
jgi:hypothetical protein|nr:MAG TPA: hypothetical protein [Bacteriophage sp.]